MKINPDQEKAVDFYDQNYAGIDPLYVEPGRRMFLGDSQNRSCRFCNKKSPDVSFRKKAHAIPELLEIAVCFRITNVMIEYIFWIYL